MIRRATPEDAPAIARVQVASWQSTYAGLLPAEFLARLPDTLAARAERWAGLVCEPDQATFVAEHGGEVVAFVSGGPARDFPGLSGELYAIYALEPAQGRGDGRRLVRALAGALLDLGHPDLMLWVLADNPARGFYQHLGGSEVGRQDLRLGGVVLPEVAYGWRNPRVLL